MGYCPAPRTEEASTSALLTFQHYNQSSHDKCQSLCSGDFKCKGNQKVSKKRNAFANFVKLLFLVAITVKRTRIGKLVCNEQVTSCLHYCLLIIHPH